MKRREFLAAALAAPVLLADVPDALARALGGTPYALVTADTEGRVAAVRLPGGRIERSIATAERPRSIESVGRTAVVCHTTVGSVSLVDAADLRVRRVLRSFGQPRYVAGGGDGKLAYVTDSARGEVAVVDLIRDRVVHRTPVGGPARHVTACGRTLWTSLGSKAERIAIVDLSDPGRPRLLGHLRPPFLAHDVGFTPRGARVWTTSGDRGRIAVYDAASRRLLFLLAAGAPPQHVTFLDGRAYVTSGRDGTLRVHALDGRRLDGTRVPQGSYNVQQGWGLVLTPSLSHGTLCIVHPHGKPIVRVEVAESSHDSCFVMAR